MKKKITLFRIAVSLILITILSMSALLIFFRPTSKPIHRVLPNTDTITETPHPVFRKDGELVFRKDGKSNKQVKIDIEIADDEPERIQGLMYRDSMPEFAGMLFMFPVEEPLDFWMKNTHISLDIMYVSSDMRIVSIASNTIPYSQEQIPSIKPAQFVVEVNAGFAARHGIKKGDYIQF